MKLVIIGGTGLIGSKLVTRLREHGHEAVPASPVTGVDTLTGEGLAEAGDVVVRDLLGPPLVVVLGEQLDAIAADAAGDFGRLVIPAGDRLVSTENGHALKGSVRSSPVTSPGLREECESFRMRG